MVFCDQWSRFRLHRFSLLGMGDRMRSLLGSGYFHGPLGDQKIMASDLKFGVAHQASTSQRLLVWNITFIFHQMSRMIQNLTTILFLKGKLQYGSKHIFWLFSYVQ